MSKEHERREELKRFLRAHRERLRPEDFGLPSRARRRTPGLRREEVAEMAGVGVAWYSWLEMGRKIRVSSKMLGGVARALRLTDDETAHLFTLAGNPMPQTDLGLRETVPPSIRQIVDHFDGPAYFVGARLDVLAWNAQAARLFDFSKTDDPLHCNIVWRMCMDPKKRVLHINWESDVQHTIASFRTHYGHLMGNPHVESLLSSLLNASPDFRLFWPQQKAEKRMTRLVNLYRDEVGPFVLELINLPIPGDPLQHVVFGWPRSTAAFARKLHRLLTSEPSEPQRAS